MTVINTNVGALTARTYALKANDAMQDAMERLSSGLRINSAADDAAGLAVANKMESQLRGMNVAIRNSQDGISLVQTAESGMSEISNMVVRMRELAVQMNNGVYTNADRQNAQLEVTALLAEIDKIAGNTAFNDVKVLDGTYVKDIRAGNTNAESISVAIDAMDTASMGGAVVTTGVKTVGTGTNAVNSSAVDVSVVVAGSGENFTLDAAQLSTQIQAKTGGYFAIEPFVNSSVSNKFQVVATGANAGDVSTKSGQSLEAGESYVFNVVYKSTADNSVVYTDKVSITASDYTPAPSTNTTVTLTTEEAKDISLTPTSVMSDRFKEYVAANTGGTYTIGSGGTDGADFSINASTGVISKGTGSGADFDFENPLDSNTNNSYVFEVTYTDQRGGVFTETVTLNVTDKTTDAAVLGNADITAGAGSTTGTFDVDLTSPANATFTMDLKTATNVSAGLQAFIADKGAANVTFTLGTVTGGVGGDITVAGTGNKDLTFKGDATASTNFTFDVTATDGTHSYVESFSMTSSADTDAAAGGSATDSSAFTGTNTTANSSAKATLGAGTTVGGEDLEVNLATLATSGSAANGFLNFKDWAAAQSGGTFSYAVQGSPTAQSGTATPSVTSAGLVSFGDGNATSGVNSIVVRATHSGGATFDQTIEIDWTAVTDANASDQASSTVAFSSVPAIVGTSSKEVIGGKSTLSVVEARQANIIAVGTNAVLSAELATFVGKAANSGGVYTLTGTDAAKFSVNGKTGDIESIQKMDFETKTSYDFNLVYTKGAKVYTENIALTVTNDAVDDVTHVADIDMSTSQGAAAAVTVLDIALNTISSAQAKLGAIQNRLQHNIDNLSMASMLTETARGRIVDADFARETSELSKQQILGQAATSMLAQANQSKQSVLALLQ